MTASLTKQAEAAIRKIVDKVLKDIVPDRDLLTKASITVKVKDMSAHTEDEKLTTLKRDAKEFMLQDIIVAEFIKDHGEQLGFTGGKVESFVNKVNKNTKDHHGLVNSRFAEELDKYLVNAMSDFKSQLRADLEDKVKDPVKNKYGADTYEAQVSKAINEVLGNQKSI